MSLLGYPYVMGSEDARSEGPVVWASQSPRRKGSREFGGWPWMALLTAAIGGQRVTECLCGLIVTCTAAAIALNWCKRDKRN